MSKLTDHLPEKEGETMLIQAKIPRELGQRVRAELDRRKLSWPDFIQAAGKQFLEEIKKK